MCADYDQVIILLIHEKCMHRKIYIRRFLNLGVLSPSHILKSMTNDLFGHHCGLRTTLRDLEEQTLRLYHCCHFFHVLVRGTT